jgi:hypothetical protein
VAARFAGAVAPGSGAARGLGRPSQASTSEPAGACSEMKRARRYRQSRVGAREPLETDIIRRLLVDPPDIQFLALPLGAALLIALEAEHRDAVLLADRLGLGAAAVGLALLVITHSM